MIVGYLGVPGTGAWVERFTRDGVSAVDLSSPSGNASEPRCEVVFSGFAGDASRAEMLLSRKLLESTEPGAVIVDRTDADPDATRTLAAELAGRDRHLVALHISEQFRVDAGIAEVVVAGGPAAALDRLRPLVNGDPAHRAFCDTADRADALHLLLSALALSTRIATLEVVAMGRKFGLDVATMAEVISKGSGRNRTSQTVLPMMAAGRATSDLTLERAAHLLRLAADVGHRDGVPMLTVGLAAGLFQAAANRYGPEASTDATASLAVAMAGTDVEGGSVPSPNPERSEADGLRVGYVGVGTMGGAIARRLMLSRPVMAYDTSVDTLAALQRDGVTAATDLAALARDCNVIFTCLPTSAHVREALFGERGLAGGLSPGKIVVDQTTGSPSETVAIAKDLEKLGIAMVDAPVSGGTRGAVAGTIAIICGGPEPTFFRVCPILEQLSPNIVYCGAIGNGHAGKLVQNAVAACNRVVTLECVAAACKAGLSLSDMIAPVNAGAAWNGGAERIIPALRTDSPTTDFAIGLMVKDLRLAMEIGNEIGAPMFVAAAACGLMEACANAFGPKSNLDTIARTVEAMAGVRFADHA